jgi:hypothetical protein
MIERSKPDGCGIERMIVCVDCMLDSSNNCNGKRIILENNHKKNSYSIYEMQGARYKRELQKGTDETLELTELQRWLLEHGYIEDEHACKEARESKLNWN